MSHKLITNTLALSLRRRDLLKGAGALGIAGAFPAIIARPARAAGQPTLVNSIRSLSNPYHATWNKGGAAFAKSVGADYVTLVTEGNSEKGIADIKAILAKTGGNCCINVAIRSVASTTGTVGDCSGDHIARRSGKWSRS